MDYVVNMELQLNDAERGVRESGTRRGATADESPVVPHPSESRRALSPGKGDDGAETAAVHP